KNERLMTAFREALRTIRQHPRFDPAAPTVLAAHVNRRVAARGPSLFRISEADDVVLDAADLPGEFAYVALGHIHRPQALGGREHVRASRQILPLDLRP